MKIQKLPSVQAKAPDPSPRQSSIRAAAAKIFYQYGYRKASMEGIAELAGVSRQTLYLQFRNKESLFHAALEHITTQTLAEVRAIAATPERAVPETLLAIFEVLCRDALGQVSRSNMVELLEVARSQEAELFAQFEAALHAVIVQTLARCDATASWRHDGIRVEDLAAHLLQASSGIKAHAQSIAEYLEKMSLAIRIITSRT
jgi:AcrR family transcriptional regulator